ncbi:MAG: MFS transporter [Acidobacteriota bacterium]
MFEAFGERDYRRFWISQFFSNIGSWMEAVAQGYLVYHLTDSPFLLGFVAFAHAIPSFFLMLYGGVLADHVDRRRLVMLSQSVQSLTALALAISIFTKHISVWQIVTTAMINGIAISFSAPAWQAMVLDLLDDRSRLANAVAMNSLQFQLSRVIGPLLAGVLLSGLGAFWCFLVNSLSFLPLIFILTRIRRRQRPVTASGGVWERLRAGFAYVRGYRTIMMVLMVSAAASAFGFPYINLMPVVARKLFPLDDARGLGFLLGAIGTGALVASLTLSIRTPPRHTMMPAIVITLGTFGAALTGVGYARTPLVAMPLLFLCGVSMVTCLALCNTALQQRVPDDMRGRVLSMYTFSFYAFIPFGNLGSGILAEHRGIGLTLLILGTIVLTSAIAAAVFQWNRRGRFRPGQA